MPNSKISGAKLKGMSLLTRYSALPADFASWTMGLEFTDNNPSKLLITSGNVEAVYDQSGNSRDFSQASAGARPSFVAGIGASFDGSNDVLHCTTNLINDIGTFFYIARFDSLNTEEPVFGKADSSIADGNSFVLRKRNSSLGNVKWTTLQVGSGQGQQGSVAINDTNFHVHVHQRRNMYVDQNQEDVIFHSGAGAANIWFTSVPSPDRMTIGGEGGSNSNTSRFGQFTVKAMHYFNAELTNQQIIRLVNGLKILYGI